MNYLWNDLFTLIAWRRETISSSGVPSEMTIFRRVEFHLTDEKKGCSKSDLLGDGFVLEKTNVFVLIEMRFLGMMKTWRLQDYHNFCVYFISIIYWQRNGKTVAVPTEKCAKSSTQHLTRRPFKACWKAGNIYFASMSIDMARCHNIQSLRYLIIHEHRESVEEYSKLFSRELTEAAEEFRLLENPLRD